MRPDRCFARFAAAAALFFCALDAHAGLAPELKCQVGKLKQTASYTSCRFKAEAKALATSLTPDFSRCEGKFNTKFPRLEEIAGPGVCPSEADLGDIRDRADDFELTIATLLSGGTIPPPVCGDGVAGVGEDCDIGDFGGDSCATQGFYNGTLACSPGCNFDTSGCNLDRYEDTGLTLIDHETGLEWEKKDAAGGGADAMNPHDADNTYLWADPASPTTQSGSAFTAFLAALNGVVDHGTLTTTGCFAGRCDWRLPTIDELQTIRNPGCGVGPCVLDAALLPMSSGRYWTGSTRAAAPAGAYFADFAGGGVLGSDTKATKLYFVRAVRSVD